MTNKIKVVHHSKTVGYSGTDRTAQLFCKYLAQSERFEPFIVYREGHDPNERLDVVKEWLGDDHVIPYKWIPGDSGRRTPFIPEDNNFANVLEKIEPDIIHIHRSGYTEWPGFKYMYPKAKWVETNIFGYNDTSPERQMDMNIYISQYIRDKALKAGNVDGPVLFNPIEQPVLDVVWKSQQWCKAKLCEKHLIPVNGPEPILLGRVGRADNFDPISLLAFKEIEEMHPHAFYIVINPCQGWRDMVEKLGIKNVRFGDPIIDDEELSNFYMGLDIYAHARHDGECCPCNIQEAMMHKVPVVSHESAIYNGQAEIIGNAGFVVPFGDSAAYRDVLIELINNPTMVNEEENGYVQLRDYFALEARRRAMRYFEAECMTAQLESIYDHVLAQ